MKQASVVSVIQVVVFLSVFPFQKADAVSVSKNADTRSGELDEVILALLASLRLSEFGYPCKLEPALHFQLRPATTTIDCPTIKDEVVGLATNGRLRPCLRH